MSSTLLPFLYRTRTIQRTGWRALPAVPFVRYAHVKRQRPAPRHATTDSSIPFEWDQGTMPLSSDPRRATGLSAKTLRKDQGVTLSPREAHIFKSIFDEIAQGNMSRQAKASQQPAASQADAVHSDWTKARLQEHERMTEFRDKYLDRFPSSLRQAGKAAFGMFELRPSDKEMSDMTEDEKQAWRERQRTQQARRDEKQRVERLMKQCTTDFALWDVLDKEVFSLPERLGIATPTKQTRRGSKKTQTQKVEEESTQYSMEIHGPLLSHYLQYALKLLETSFGRPSPLAFEVLPRIKAQGLTAYVLGATTGMYTTLARMYWEGYGDAQSVLGLVREMNSSGLYPDEALCEVLAGIGRQVYGCAAGVQGPFVQAVAATAGYEDGVVETLGDFEKMMRFQVGRGRG